MSELYTASRLKVLRQCMQLHYYRYILGIQTPSGPAAKFGTVAHSALEAWLKTWQAGKLDQRLPAMLTAVRDADIPEHDKCRLMALLTAYHYRWCDQPWEIIAVETEFRYEIDGYTIGGKLDALIRNTETGETWVLEHKTTKRDASPGSSYWEVLSIDAQISIYVDGATMLGHEIAGCIYDVLKRPLHEQRLATPTADRKFTEGKGCKSCGGSAKAGATEKGRGYTVVSMVTVEHVPCADCDGTGWKKDKAGKIEAPRLYANQRDTDETLDEFTDRMIDEIAAEPDSFLIRGVVVRLEDELPRMRTEIVDSIKYERMTSMFNLHIRNPEACAQFGTICHFFGPCSGRSDIDDEHLFPRGQAHPELATAA